MAFQNRWPEMNMADGWNGGFESNELVMRRCMNEGAFWKS